MLADGGRRAWSTGSLAVSTRGAKGGAAASRLPLPAVGAIVGVIRVEGDRTWRTRVEGTEELTICVVAPLRPAGESFAFGPAEPLQVVWANDRGVLVASGTLRAIEHDVVDLWVIDVLQVERSQRREAFRLPLTAPIVVGGWGQTSAGETRDLSETGLRCRLPARSAPAPGDAVEATLELPEQPSLVLAGAVAHRDEVTRPLSERIATNSPAPEVELGIAFVGLDAAVTERLRRFVFDEQLRRRSAP